MHCFIVFPFFLKYLTNAEYRSIVELLRRYPHWWSPVISSAYGVKLDSRMLAKILYVVGKSQGPYYPLPSQHLPLSHLTSCTPTKSNLYLANSLDAAVIEPDLYRFLTISVPNVMSRFHCLGHNKILFHVRGTCSCFVTKSVFKVRSYQHLAQSPS